MKIKKKHELSHRTHTERAYQIIKGAILRGESREGAFLLEREFLEKHGIGRTPFREACNRLHHEQLLEVVPHRGYLVPELSFRAVRDLCDARRIIEGAIVEVAVLRASPLQIEELQGLAEKGYTIENSWRDSTNNIDTIEEFVSTNMEFHKCIARMTQNNELVRMASGILERHARFSYLEIRNARFQAVGLQRMHISIVDAIRKRDPVVASRSVLADLDLGQALMLGQHWPTLDGIHELHGSVSS
jgi:DNA-binding GntR family transcriptional regulator